MNILNKVIGASLILTVSQGFAADTASMIKTMPLISGKQTPTFQQVFQLKANQACLLDEHKNKKTYSWLQAAPEGGFIIGGEMKAGKAEGGIHITSSGVKNLSDVPPVHTTERCMPGLYVNMGSKNGVDLMSFSETRHLVYIHSAGE